MSDQDFWLLLTGMGCGGGIVALTCAGASCEGLGAIVGAVLFLASVALSLVSCLKIMKIEAREWEAKHK